MCNPKPNPIDYTGIRENALHGSIGMMWASSKVERASIQVGECES